MLPHYDTEQASAAAFDALLQAANLFTLYREVCGTLTQPRPGQIERGMRIDRILVPNQRLLDAGWTQGIIGVELKRSDVKIGPPIAQAMDYARTTWTLPGSRFQVVVSWVFIWPMPKQHGPIASILAQNRIGSATSDDWTMLQLKSGEQNILRVSWQGDLSLGAATNGHRAGSR